MDLTVGTPGFVIPRLTEKHIAQIKHAFEVGVPGYTIEDMSKSQYMSMRILDYVKSSTKVYLPVHFVVMLMRLRSKKYSKMSTFKRFLGQLVKSVAFGTVYGTCVPLSVTYLDFCCNTKWATYIIWLVTPIFASAIFLESKERWAEITLYVVGQWFQGFTGSLVKREYLPMVPHIDKYILGLSMAIMTAFYYGGQNESGDKPEKREKIDVVLQYLLGDKSIVKS